MIEPLSPGNLRINSGNLRFLPILVEAGQAYAMPVAILATIITAEARMRPADGDVTWDETSYNALGEAAGLAQFTRPSWLAHARRKGGALNTLAIERGMLGANGDVLDEAALLALRFDPRLSILLTAETARRNLDNLNARGMDIEGMGAGSFAKVIYLAHHEGAEGAYRYMIGARPEPSRARFESNVPPKQWPQDRSGPALTRCYYDWLEGYIDRRIDVRRYLLETGEVDVPRLASLGRPRPHRLLRLWLKERKAALKSLGKPDI